MINFNLFPREIQLEIFQYCESNITLVSKQWRLDYYKLVPKSLKNEIIIYASKNEHLEVVKLLIEHGADVTADNNYAIRWASKNKHLEVVKLLIENGAVLDVVE